MGRRAVLTITASFSVVIGTFVFSGPLAGVPASQVATAPYSSGASARNAVGVASRRMRTGQQSRCADCHFANIDAPAREHLSEWDVSPHGREQVGCQSCHGGNPASFEALVAHQGILGPPDPDSPVNRRNLPRTCGNCHTGVYVAFQRSRHLELLEAGDERGPTCSTCHGSVAAHLLSPRALEARCASCHAADKAAPRPEYPTEGRAMLERIAAVRALLDDAAAVIRRVRDREVRALFESDYRQAEVPLLEATDAGHAFEFDQLDERLSTARRRVEDLLERLAVRGADEEGVSAGG